MISTIEYTLKHVVFLARHLKDCDLQYVITAALLELGVPTKTMGFDYLEKAILIFFEHPARTLTKDIYPTVGNSYTPPVTAYQVEKSIRGAINEAWKERNDRIWCCYFPPDESGRIRRPSNGEFISMLARFLQLWQGSCKGVRQNYE